MTGRYQSMREEADVDERPNIKTDPELDEMAKAVYDSVYQDGLLLHKWEDAGQLSREIYGYDIVQIVYDKLLEAGRIVW